MKLCKDCIHARDGIYENEMCSRNVRVTRISPVSGVEHLGGWLYAIEEREASWIETHLFNKCGMKAKHWVSKTQPT